MNASMKKCADCGDMKHWGSINGYGVCSSCTSKARDARAAKGGLISDFGPEADAAVVAACAQFPDTFKLHGHEGTFRSSVRSSYVSQGKVMVYTQRLQGEEWLDFAKGTVEELKSQIKR